jgi:hypothetical protein
MRVVATESFKTYYKMVCIDVEEGEGFDGEFADFLITGGAPVEPAGADKSPEPAAPQRPEDPPAGPESDSDPEPDGEPGDELDITGTAADVLEWVGDDPQRAAEARAAESAKDKPRSTLLTKLDAIAGP